MSRDARRSHAYAAENVAFADTLLGERPGFSTLVVETNAMLSSQWWKDAKLPLVTIEQIVSATIDGDANSSLRRIRYTHSACRSTVPHELAHIATPRLTKRDIQPHGPEWRGAYVAITSLLYGHQYAERLLKAFKDGNLNVDLLIAGMPHTTPLVDVDALGGVVCGGWRR